MRNFILALAFGVFTLFAAAAQAQMNEEPEFVEGRDYFKLTEPVKHFSSGNEIEVLTFFWYGCGGCYQVDPELVAWEATLPKNVKFIRLPALFSPAWDLHGQIFLALEALKVNHSVHVAMFEAVQNKRMQFTDRKELLAFVKEQGVDPDAFLKIFDSPEIKARMEQIKKAMADYDFNLVPAMIINGKYRFDYRSAGKDPKRFIELANFLVKKEIVEQ